MANQYKKNQNRKNSKQKKVKITGYNKKNSKKKLKMDRIMDNQ